ncbi:hypothetical protein IDJ77_22405 [Mucilaginibacter sp. ZT4R22]|uniref:CRP-like cAMP-binding protein n=1 Tax=Mucilaginibacter pankratovii TaxID=2772110 RepID=A0ABR7WWB5_9SPHI|nr:hypothetical protein [Mucilaginibacter pankratovii]MBD1366583.1 hypothetical protein [Mucilaginibacter pankratovii]
MPMREHEAIINKVFRILCSYKPQPEALRDHLTQVLDGRFYPDRKILFERGSIVKDVLFVSDGYVACYGFSDAGDRQVLSIAAKNTIVSGKSFTTQTPSTFEWVCLPGTYLMAIGYEALQDTHARFPGTEELSRIVIAEAAERELLERLSLYKDAEMVVKNFYNSFKEFKIPGRMMLDVDIASYLLIGESTLRNVRGKLIKDGRW